MTRGVNLFHCDLHEQSICIVSVCEGGATASEENHGLPSLVTMSGEVTDVSADIEGQVARSAPEAYMPLYDLYYKQRYGSVTIL